MLKVLKVVVLGFVTLFFSILPVLAEEAPRAQQAAAAQEAPKAQEAPAALEAPKAQETPKAQLAAKELGKGLDEQVQEIKTDVLSIATDLNQLEEKLLYPSDTQIALFVSVTKGEKFRLDAVDIELDGKQVAHHLYTFKELEALQKGGVQRIYVGNVRTGEHALKVTSLGKTEGGSDFRKDESFKVAKNIGPKLVGVVLAGTGIGSKPITVKDW